MWTCFIGLQLFDKRYSNVYTSGGAIKSRIMLNQLADELQKSLENLKT